MEEFAKCINEIPVTLDRFISNKKIVKEEVEKTFKETIEKIVEKQNRILNDGRLSLENQTVIFGALRTIKNVTESMQSSLIIAESVGENPTTAEKCTEITPLMIDVTNQILDFNPFKDINGNKLENIFNLSRVLRKKAKNMGFSKSIDEEFSELDMDSEEISNFINTLNENIQNKLEI